MFLAHSKLVKRGVAKNCLIRVSERPCLHRIEQRFGYRGPLLKAGEVGKNFIGKCVAGISKEKYMTGMNRVQENLGQWSSSILQGWSQLKELD